MYVAENVLEELDSLVDRDPDLTGARGSLFISTKVPAACIREKSRYAFLKYLLDLPGFTQYPKIVPVENRRFDIVLLGTVAVKDGKIVLDGKELEIL